MLGWCLRSILPHQQLAIHGNWSGNVFRTTEAVPIPREVTSKFDYPRPGTEERTFESDMTAGDAVFCHGDGMNEVCISYAEGRFSDGSSAPAYVAPLAQVDENHSNDAKFLQKCRELYTQGMKRTTYRRKE